MKEFRWVRTGKKVHLAILCIQQCPYLHRRFGLGLTAEGGSLGSTFGQSGIDVYREFQFTFIAWTVLLKFYWKRLEA